MQPENSVIKFDTAQIAKGLDTFRNSFNQDLEQLDPALLPLQQGLVHGSHVTDDPIKTLILTISEESDSLLVKVGIFYNSVIAGCSCADDPTPVDTNQEYCVLEFQINKKTGETVVCLLPDS